jgi:nitrite reductase (NO-forming)
MCKIEAVTSLPGAPAPRRCRRRTLPPGGRRPSEVIALFFAAGLTSLLAGAVTAIVHAAGGAWWLHWASLHLLFVGGVSQLVLGAGQFFVCAFLATEPPSRRLVAAQLAAWNTGTGLVVAGVPTATVALTTAGGALLLLGLALYATALVRMERRSLQQARWALRWYEAAAACLALGALLGVLMARGTVWTHGSLLGAHLALNLGGWFGTAIVGTLHTFFPSLTQTPLRRPRLQGVTFVLWVAGIAELAIGAAWDSRLLVASGWLDLLVAAVLLSVNVLGSLLAAPRPLGLPARLLAVAHAFLPAGLVVALVATVQTGTSAPFVGATRPAVATLLLAGWIGLTVAGSLLHLLAVLARVRDLRRPMPAVRPLRDLAIAALAAGAVTLGAVAHVPVLAGLRDVATVALVAAAAMLGGQVLVRATRAIPRPAGRPGRAPGRTAPTAAFRTTIRR